MGGRARAVVKDIVFIHLAAGLAHARLGVQQQRDARRRPRPGHRTGRSPSFTDARRRSHPHPHPPSHLSRLSPPPPRRVPVFSLHAPVLSLEQFRKSGLQLSTTTRRSHPRHAQTLGRPAPSTAASTPASALLSSRYCLFLLLLLLAALHSASRLLLPALSLYRLSYDSIFRLRFGTAALH